MVFFDAKKLPEGFGWAALEHLPSAVALKDDQLRYCWINEAYTTFFNVSLDSVIGRTNAEAFRADVRLSDTGAERRALERLTVVEDLDTYFLPDGAIREALASHRGFRDSVGTSWLISSFHDISDVVDANHSLIEHAEGLTAESDVLRQQALVDPLTSALNRRGLEQSAALALHNTTSDGTGVLVVDIDKFKSVNDNYGHDAGDAVLRLVANVLGNRTRDGDIVARLGGESSRCFSPTLRHSKPA